MGLHLAALLMVASGLEIKAEDIQKDLDKRKPGSSKYTTQRKEDDSVETLSGVFEGKTTGTPIALIIKNKDQKSKDYDKLKDVFRPSHADYTYTKKYGFRDHRGGGRSSARETTMRVAAGSIAKKYLKELVGINIKGYLSQIGNIKIKKIDLSEVDNNPFFCPDPEIIENIETLIDELRSEGDSVGARIEIMASNLPVGLGEPVFDKLDLIAKGLMSINAVEGVEIGGGFGRKGQRRQLLQKVLRQILRRLENKFWTRNSSRNSTKALLIVKREYGDTSGKATKLKLSHVPVCIRGNYC